MNSLIGFLRSGRLVLAAVAVSLILAALIVPAFQGALISSDLTNAENTAHNLENAISAYFTEHRNYPAFESSYDADLVTDFHLMDVLMGTEYTLADRAVSPRLIAYYAGKEAKLGEDAVYRKGLSKTSDGRYELWDPWGNHYYVRLDTNYDNQIADPSGDGEPIPESILVWSAGPDGNSGTWKDNVKTW